MTALRRLLVGLLALFSLLLVSAPSRAHELRPGALGLQEVAQGRFLVQWSPAAVTRGDDWSVGPRFPAHCTLAGVHLDCGQRGLDGVIDFPGLQTTMARVVVYVTYLDGRSTTAVVSADAPSLAVQGARAGERLQPPLTVAAQYAGLGIEHILLGFDHLLFVLGLVLLVGLERKLVLTVTAFTLAHSLTLAASVLGLIDVPQAPVEAVIALSILLLAVECSRKADSLAKRAPWAVAFSFGLLHGFGFAGALREIGLPPGQVPVALASFNVGVELGQLAVIAAAWLCAKLLLQKRALPAVVPRLAVYGLGSLAAYWSLDRTISAFWPS